MTDKFFDSIQDDTPETTKIMTEDGQLVDPGTSFETARGADLLDIVAENTSSVVDSSAAETLTQTPEKPKKEKKAKEEKIVAEKPQVDPAPAPAVSVPADLAPLKVLVEQGPLSVPQFRDAAGLGNNAVIILRQYEADGLVERYLVNARGIWTVTDAGRALLN